MKLSAKTISVLKNFSQINPSIVIKPGDVVETMSPTKTIIARASVPDKFPVQVPIYALNRFLSCLSLFEDPELDFGKDSVKITGKNNSIVYHYSEPSVIVVPPDKPLKLPSCDVECNVTNRDLQNVVKALGVLGLPEIALVGNGETIQLQAADCSKQVSADTYSIAVGETDSHFRAVFKPENLKLIDGDYQIKISQKGISQFIGADCQYWVAIEAKSSQFSE